MVFLDGSGSLNNNVRVPVVFDNLIAKHDLPPLIGIFVDPGVLPTALASAQNRFERVFEYDSLGDRTGAFLLRNSFPPWPASTTSRRAPTIMPSRASAPEPSARSMAAWNRPDQFHRVLSFIGTFVAMKGADALPALIRKTEPKPIRVFLQDGKNDHVVPAEPFGHLLRGQLAHQQSGDVRSVPS